MKYSEINQKIIETASSLFYKNGYNATGINEIIAESEIAKATLYNHFKSKEDICIAYLRFKNEAFLKDITSYTRSKAEGKAQILAIFDFLQLFFRDKDFNGCWCIKTISEIPKDNERIKNEIQNQKMNFIQFIRELLQDNLKNLNAEALNSLSRKIYLLYEGAVAESHLHQAEWPIVEAREMCEQTMQ